jgi:hypothetical protein
VDRITAHPVSPLFRSSHPAPRELDGPPPSYAQAMGEGTGTTAGSSNRHANTAIASKPDHNSKGPASASNGKLSNHPDSVIADHKHPSWETDMRSAIETWIHERKEYIRLKPKRGTSSCTEIEAGTSLDPVMIARQHERAAEDIHKVMRQTLQSAMTAGCDDTTAKRIIDEATGAHEAAGAWWAREKISPLWETGRRAFEEERAEGG